MDTPSAAPVAVSPGCTQRAPREDTIQDLELAAALGFEHPADIRKLIASPLPVMAALGPLRYYCVPTFSDGSHIETVPEFHLTQTQAAFLTAKAGTERADSLTILMAEIFVMVSDGRLVAVDADAAAELAEAQARDLQRSDSVSEA